MTDKLFMKLKLTTLLAFVACAFISCAATFELARNPKNVLYVSTAGNDSTAWYGTMGRPWKTVAAAITAAQPGDKIIVGAGNFTNAPGVQLLPAGCSLVGNGTNSTFIYNGLIWCFTNNELANFSFISDNDSSGGTTTSGGAIEVRTNNYLHNLVVVSQNKCISGSPPIGYNMYSNCVFITGDHGIIIGGPAPAYFLNCAVLKTNNTASTSSYLVAAQFQSAIYWNGGTLTSTTNATGQPTNNCGFFHGSTASGTQNFFIENTTISVPTGGYDLFGKSGVTNFVLNATYTQTNLAAINIPFAGFDATNPPTSKWQASWQARINTNAQFLLPAPPTNSP